MGDHLLAWIIFGGVFFVLSSVRALGIKNWGPKWLNRFVQGQPLGK
jgi:hypothetical protein